MRCLSPCLASVCGTHYQQRIERRECLNYDARLVSFFWHQVGAHGTRESSYDVKKCKHQESRLSIRESRSLGVFELRRKACLLFLASNWHPSSAKLWREKSSENSIKTFDWRLVPSGIVWRDACAWSLFGPHGTCAHHQQNYGVKKAVHNYSIRSTLSIRALREKSAHKMIVPSHIETKFDIICNLKIFLSSYYWKSWRDIPR